MGPTDFPTQEVIGTLTLGVKWLELQDYHSPQSTTSLKLVRAITSSPLHVSFVWTVTNLPFDLEVVSRLNTAAVKPNNNKYYRIYSASNIITNRFHGVSWCLQEHRHDTFTLARTIFKWLSNNLQLIQWSYISDFSGRIRSHLHALHLCWFFATVNWLKTWKNYDSSV